MLRRALPLAVALLLPSALGAQRDLARADSLLRLGRVASAESLLYRAVLRRPRDPAARLALGRYLAARGAVKVGSVLIEEARFFGLPPAMAALHLAPLYARVDAWPAVATLEGAILTAGERERARWLADHMPTIAGPDSAVVTFRPATPAAPHEGASLGSMVLRIGADSVIADIDPDVRGLVLDRTRATMAGVRRFTGGATDERQYVGVAARVQLGAYTLANLPVSFAPLGATARARIGLDLLARFSPTFDPARQRAVLRRSGRLPRAAAAAAGVRLPLLLETRGSWVARGGRLENLSAGVTSRALLDSAWTLDGRRGEIVIGR